jgi:hypothetical protein
MARKRIEVLDKMKQDCRLCEHFTVHNGCSYPSYAPMWENNMCRAWEMNHLIVSFGKRQYISGSDDCHKAFVVGKKFNDHVLEKNQDA